MRSLARPLAKFLVATALIVVAQPFVMPVVTRVVACLLALTGRPVNPQPKPR